MSLSSNNLTDKVSGFGTGRMDYSPLNNLPREIRDHIYTLPLKHTNDVTLDLSHSGKGKNRKLTASTRCRFLRRQRALALLSTCKQVRCEAAPIFFEVNSFRFYHNADWDVWTHLAEGENDLYAEMQNDRFVQRASRLGPLRTWVEQTVNKQSTRIGRITVGLGWIYRTNFAAEDWLHRFTTEVVHFINSLEHIRTTWAVSLTVASRLLGPMPGCRKVVFEGVPSLDPSGGVKFALVDDGYDNVYATTLPDDHNDPSRKDRRTVCKIIEGFVDGVQTGVEAVQETGRLQVASEKEAV